MLDPPPNEMIDRPARQSCLVVSVRPSGASWADDLRALQKSAYEYGLQDGMEKRCNWAAGGFFTGVGVTLVYLCFRSM